MVCTVAHRTIPYPLLRGLSAKGLAWVGGLIVHIYYVYAGLCPLGGVSRFSFGRRTGGAVITTTSSPNNSEGKKDTSFRKYLLDIGHM